MKAKQRIYGDFPRLVLILLCLAILLRASLAVQGQAAKLRLIGEEQLEDFESMAEVIFLEKPKSVAPGQAEFSPILFVSKDGERYTVRAQGAGIRSFQRGQSKQLQNYLTRETLHLHELSGLVHKVVTSPNSELAEVLFWDGRRMLFERTQ